MSKEFEENVLEKLEAIQTTLYSVNERLDSVDERLDSVDERLDSVDERLDSLDIRLGLVEKKVSEIDAINTRLDSLEERFDKMQKSVILIEHKVSVEIPALFDGYTSNYEIQKQDEKKINSLEQENFNHSIRISNLEITTDEHSRQIKKLIS